ncbi:lactate 2-monooxygenase, partial [Rhodococcus hoagii]|nr:lactate 2-monooxygenase [Prescottella equi]
MQFGSYQKRDLPRGAGRAGARVPDGVRRARGEGHRRDVGVAVLVRRGRRGRRDHPRRNVEAFEQWGLLPRMLVGAETPGPHGRGLGHTFASPVFMAPVGVIGLCDRDRTATSPSHRRPRTPGVPAMFSTLMEDPLEDVVRMRVTFPASSSSTPRRTGTSPRASSSGPKPPYRGITVTLDTWGPG